MKNDYERDTLICLKDRAISIGKTFAARIIKAIQNCDDCVKGFWKYQTAGNVHALELLDELEDEPRIAQWVCNNHKCKCGKDGENVTIRCADGLLTTNNLCKGCQKTLFAGYVI